MPNPAGERRDAALQRGAIERNAFLPRQSNWRFVKLIPLRDENLRAHQVDAGNHFGYRVFDLNARIHLDEIPLLRIDIVEKLDGPCIAIVGLARELHRRAAQFAPNARVEIRGGSNFHDFLMAALHRTISFVKMQQVAVMVRENLNFQVPRAWQIFFQEEGSVAEGGARFSLGFFQQSVELRGVMNDAHAAASAAHRRLHDEGIANLLRNLLRLFG